MGKAILVVRDETDFAARLTEALKAAGVEGRLVLAADLSEAARLFNDAGQFRDALPAMVMVPPVVDVLSLLKVLRSKERTRSLPVFVVRTLAPAERPG